MEIDNKYTEHVSYQASPYGMDPGMGFSLITNRGGWEETILYVCEDEAELLNQWDRGEYKVIVFPQYSEIAKLANFAIGIYKTNGTMSLDWNVHVISKNDPIYKALDRLQHQKYLHIIIYDTAGRSHEAIERKNTYRETQHSVLDGIQDIAIGGNEYYALLTSADKIFPLSDVKRSLQELLHPAIGQ